MSGKKFILNSDNFGTSKNANRAVLEGYHNGFLTGASLSANGNAFNAAVNEIIPECPKLSVGVHLNIIDGFSLTKASLLTNKKGKFNNNFYKVLLKSNDVRFLEQVEFEFRTQIETVMNYTKVNHIDSNSHIHAIPNIFKLTAKLAKEYNIPYVRTHYEEFCFVPYLQKHLNLRYLLNISKMLFLNSFSKNNFETAKKVGLKSNNYIIGCEYHGLMDNNTVETALSVIDEECLVECVINPATSFGTSKREYTEFLITKNKELKDKIARLGFEITDYSKEN